MKFNQQINFIYGTQFYHLFGVRILFVLTQEKAYCDFYFFIEKWILQRNIDNILCHLIIKVKVLLVYQEQKRVNPHSQSCAYNPRFRPS